MCGSWPRFSHNIITQAQYSYLVATVIGSAVVPTMVANSLFMPTHLLPRQDLNETIESVAEGSL
jgi:glutathione-regulated potassium-efflux system ancillary protein KefC